MSAENDVLITDCHEWAIQCYDRDGNLFTGRHVATRREAVESGERLTRINGADWWLISRRRVVTVETSPWWTYSPDELSGPISKSAEPDARWTS